MEKSSSIGRLDLAQAGDSLEFICQMLPLSLADWLLLSRTDDGCVLDERMARESRRRGRGNQYWRF